MFAGKDATPPIGGFMDLKYPQWQEPLAAAMLEFDTQRLRRKLQEANEAIARRFKELAFENDNQEELGCSLTVRNP